MVSCQLLTNQFDCCLIGRGLFHDRPMEGSHVYGGSRGSNRSEFGLPGAFHSTIEVTWKRPGCVV